MAGAADKDIQAQIKAIHEAITQLAQKDEVQTNYLINIAGALDLLIAERSAKPSRGSRAASAASADGTAPAKTPATEAFPRDVKTYFVREYLAREELREKFEALTVDARNRKEYVSCKGDDNEKLKKEASLIWAGAINRSDMDGLVQEIKTEYAKAREDRKAKAGVVAPAPASEEVVEAAKADLTAVAAKTTKAKAPAASKAPKAAATSAPVKESKAPKATKTPKVAIPVPQPETDEDDVIPSDED